jgi:hypothetical protein
MDLGNFLVTGYIYPHIVGCALAYPLELSRSIAKKTGVALVYGWGVALEFTRVAFG